MRVVLINYEQTLLSALRGFLETFPNILIVGAFRDEESALADIQSLEPQMVLIDLDKKGSPAADAIQKLRSNFADLIIIAISINDTNKFREAVIQAGANAFVSKSRVIHDLVPAMQHEISKLSRNDEPDSPQR
jgi:DNA-binding NarL/FixJ family response regulator